MSWPTKALGEICDLEIGKTPSRANPDFWRGGTLPWLSIADMNQGRHLRKTKECVTEAGAKAARMKLVSSGTLVLSYKLSIGKVGFVETPLFTNEAIAALSNLHRDVDAGFLYWALQHIDLLEGADRAAMGNTLNKAKLEKVRIPLPPLPEQRRIAAILDKADALRAKRRLAIAKLDQLLQSVFLEMFGDPTLNPKKWTLVALSEVAAIWTGKTPPSALEGMFGGGIPFVTPGDLDSDLSSCQRTLTAAGASYTKVVRSGAALVGCIGNIGKMAKASKASAFNQQINAVDWDASVVDDDFGIAALAFTKSQMLAKSSSTTVPILNKSAFSGVEIVLPPLELQREFANKIRAVKAKMTLVKNQFQSIDLMFASLQQQAFKADNVA